VLAIETDDTFIVRNQRRPGSLPMLAGFARVENGELELEYVGRAPGKGSTEAQAIEQIVDQINWALKFNPLSKPAKSRSELNRRSPAHP
jgi:hypothetical protein